ncbi:hypothetical protein LCGC14_1136370 [marine sediment metagenome]|uniref:SecC motif-containing protein n=1 Tax=marine sediment metagenome TaxID=412755 RepID=A0A0F9PHS0_9ZZZZ
MSDEDIINKLKDFKNRYHNQEENDEIASWIYNLREKYVISGDQEQAKETWRLEKILLIQLHYINAFRYMKRKEFYEGWCSLELSEKNLEYLSQHFDLNEPGDPFFLIFIKNQVKKFQEIYPNYSFHSTGTIIKTSVCSICGEIITPRNHCGHKLREIYDGKRCIRYIKDFEPDHIAIVKKPHWKWRVLFPKDEETGEKIDNFNYSFVNYLIEILPSPFDDFDYKWEDKLIPHSEFKEINEDDMCPCRSGKTYLECCLEKEGILMPFILFEGFKPLKEPTTINKYQTKPKNSNNNEISKGPFVYEVILIKEACFFID